MFSLFLTIIIPYFIQDMFKYFIKIENNLLCIGAMDDGFVGLFFKCFT